MMVFVDEQELQGKYRDAGRRVEASDVIHTAPLTILFPTFHSSNTRLCQQIYL